MGADAYYTSTLQYKELLYTCVLVFTSDTFGTLWTEKWKWTLSVHIRCLFCFYVQFILDKAGEAIVLNNYKDSEI